MTGKKDEILYDDFTVLDLNYNRVSGLVDGDFTVSLFDPDGNEVSLSITVTITELGGGDYRAEFTPNKKGLWKLTIFHAEYFPAGKTNNYQVFNAEIDDVDISEFLDIEEGDWELVPPNDLYFYVKGTRTGPGVGTILAHFKCYDIDGNATIDDVARVENVT